MKIAIAGAGNMGSWLAMELSAGHEIGIYSRTKEKALAVAEKCGNATVLDSLEEISQFRPAMLINAVSLPQTIRVFEDAEKFLPRDCVLCDVASIKGEIPAYYKRCGFRFGSVHPMFGPTFANVRNLADEYAVIITESDPVAAEFFRKFFRRLGLNIYHCTFEEHDRMMAYSLALPFSSTLVFAACMNSKAVPGTTFKKHMEIAKGLLSEDDWLLTEIMMNKYAIKELEEVTARLEYLKHIMRQRDEEEMAKFISVLRKNIF